MSEFVNKKDKDSAIYKDDQEIADVILEEINPRVLTTEIVDADVISVLREAKKNVRVNIDPNKILEPYINTRTKRTRDPSGTTAPRHRRRIKVRDHEANSKRF